MDASNRDNTILSLFENDKIGRALQPELSRQHRAPKSRLCKRKIERNQESACRGSSSVWCIIETIQGSGQVSDCCVSDSVNLSLSFSNPFVVRTVPKRKSLYVFSPIQKSLTILAICAVLYYCTQFIRYCNTSYTQPNLNSIFFIL